MTSAADNKLIENLGNQLRRLVDQLTDLESYKDDLPDDEYDTMKEETMEQMKEFTETLTRLQKEDFTLNSKFSVMKASLRDAIAKSWKPTDMIKLFGEQDLSDLEQQLSQLEEDFRLKKLDLESFNQRKFEILLQQQAQGAALDAHNAKFVQNMQDSAMLNTLEQVND